MIARSAFFLLCLVQVACDNAQFVDRYSVSYNADAKENPNPSETPASEPTPANEENPAGSETIIDASSEAIPTGTCDAIGPASRAIHVSGSENRIILEKNASSQIKVTGDRNEVGLTLTGSQDPANGLCLFIAGNQNKVKIQIEGQVGKLVIKARGNQPEVDIEVLENAALLAIASDEAGNKPQITVHGKGRLP